MSRATNERVCCDVSRLPTRAGKNADMLLALLPTSGGGAEADEEKEASLERMLAG